MDPASVALLVGSWRLLSGSPSPCCRLPGPLATVDDWWPCFVRSLRCHGDGRDVRRTPPPKPTRRISKDHPISDQVITQPAGRCTTRDLAALRAVQFRIIAKRQPRRTFLLHRFRIYSVETLSWIYFYFPTNQNTKYCLSKIVKYYYYM